MKKTISTLQDALAYQLQGLFYAETRVRDEFKICSAEISSPEVASQIRIYIDNTANTLQKLERIFSYLMEEPGSRKNDVILKLMEETHHLLDYTEPAHLKDILMVSCIQNINAYKTAAYRSAYLFAVQLEMDNVTDLIQQILEWEVTSSKSLALLSLHEFNRANDSLKAE